MIIEIIRWLVMIYCVVAFILALTAMITNYKNLKKLKWWEQILFFVLQPLLIIRG
jgi:hypothetical protein